MPFTSRIVIEDKKYDIVWDDGDLKGDADLISKIKHALEIDPDYYGIPTVSGLHQGLDVLKSGISFFFFITSQFENVEVIDGEIEDSPHKLPEGMIT